MVSVYPNPPTGHQDFYYYTGMEDPMKMDLPGLHSLQPETNANSTPRDGNNSDTGGVLEDPNKKVRKPYTITKSRESWTEQEHDKFLEALQLFDRDWKKIEAFVGSKTVIQIRSHAQKYFLKVQKSGASEHVPPPRPKRKASHPYPQKAPKNAVPQVGVHFQSPSLFEPHVIRPDSLSVPRSSMSNAALSPWTYNSVPIVNMSHMTKDDMGLAGTAIVHNYSSSSNESTPRICPINKTNDQVKEKGSKPARVMPDFAQVYGFIGSMFDPNATYGSDHLQRLRKMDPINVETVLMLMKNLCVNLVSPEFEEHRRMIATHSADKEEDKKNVPKRNFKLDNLESVVQSM